MQVWLFFLQKYMTFFIIFQTKHNLTHKHTETGRDAYVVCEQTNVCAELYA